MSVIGLCNKKVVWISGMHSSEFGSISVISVGKLALSSGWLPRGSKVTVADTGCISEDQAIHHIRRENAYSQQSWEDF